jgi:hypothetical protein
VYEMDNMKKLKYEKLHGSLICFNQILLSSTKNVHGRVPVLVTCLAPENETISTTLLASFLSPPDLEPHCCVDAWKCVAWPLSKLGVEDGEINNTLEYV